LDEARCASCVLPSDLRAEPGSLLEISRPPPVRMLLSMPTDLPPTIAALSGMLKYSAMPRRCTGDVDESSHISRKNAIIAVMKSA